jgi:hypothetical protein
MFVGDGDVNYEPNDTDYDDLPLDKDDPDLPSAGTLLDAGCYRHAPYPVTLTAVSGMAPFVSWSGDVTSFDNPATFDEVGAVKAITATFSLIGDTPMAKIARPHKQAYTKVTHKYFNEGWELVRDVGAADSWGTTSLPIGPHQLWNDSQPIEGSYLPDTAAKVAMRIFSDIAGADINIAILLQDPAGPGNRTDTGKENVQTLAVSKVIFDGVIATSAVAGVTTAGFHPITGDVTTGVSWIEMSGVADIATISDGTRLVTQPTVTAAVGLTATADIPCEFLISCQGAHIIYPVIRAMGQTATRIVIGVKRVE